MEGLLALELFHLARTDARTRPGGDLVLLADQDRGRWDQTAVRSGNAVLATALRRLQPGPHQLQAVIAAHHANAAGPEDTDWPAVAAAYRQLASMTGSPVVAVNHAVAVAEADGPAAGLALLDTVAGHAALKGYHLLPAVRGDLLAKLGRNGEARAEFARAASLTRNERERAFLEGRAAALG